MRTIWRGDRLLAVVALIMLVNGQRSRGDDSALVQTIVKAWRDRQAKAVCFDVTAVGTEFRAAANFSASDLEAMGQRSNERGIAADDMSFEIRLRFACDGNGRFRLEYDGKSAAPAVDGYPDQQIIDVVDGKVRTTVFPVSHAEYPSGHIREQTSPTPARNAQALPLVLVYRAVSDQPGLFDSTKLTVAANDSVIDGRRCVVLAHLDSMIWVDPERECVPMRYHHNERGVTMRTIEIKYAEDPKHGWAPTSWTNIQLQKDGKVAVSVSATVKQSEFGDEMAESTFRADMPLGAWVRDYIQGTSYIIREDGSRRNVHQLENGKTYKELLETEPPNQDVGFRGRRWLLLANVTLIVLIAVVYYLYQRHGRARR